MSQEVSKRLVSGLSSQYIPLISSWNNPLILTIDPNFQRDILVRSPRNLRISPHQKDLFQCFLIFFPRPSYKWTFYWKLPDAGDLFSLVIFGRRNLDPMFGWFSITMSPWPTTMWEKIFGALFYKQIQGCVKPGGRLIYGTCSLLHQENAGVVEAFEANEGENFQTWPFKTGRWHGFFN